MEITIGVDDMKEKVGNCRECGQIVYCNGGFLDGSHEDGKLLCAECSESLDD